MDAVAKHRYQRELFGDEHLGELLAPELSRALPPARPSRIPADAADPVTFFQAEDVRTYMLDDILTKVDRTSMANSLEVRVPLLDHKVVELAFSLPLNMRVRWDAARRRARTKYLLKRSAARFFPEEFLERPKQGFGIPIVEWCRGPLRPLQEPALRDSRNPIFEWLRFEAVQRLLDEFYRGRDPLVARVWALASFDLWMREVHLGK
jgi:asparagine synthase (glutamine-hydrolysing)